MDSKNWGNLGGSTVTGRSLEAPLQHQQLSATSASVYSVTSSLPVHPTAHWQRVTYCSAVNDISSSRSNLPQQHNQVQQEASQLRYFQVSKVQYFARNASYSEAHPQPNLTPQHNFPRHYAVVAATPALSSTQSSTERSRINGSVSHSNYQTVEKSSTIASTLISAEDIQIHHRKSSNRQNSLCPVYYSRYKILTSRNFLIPANCRVSLTTCFDLTSTTDPFLVESATSSSSLIDQVSLIPRIIPAPPKSSLPCFVNAFEAVPDMLRDIRPGTSNIFVRSPSAPFLVSQEEFSYHVGKPRLSVRVKASIITRVERLLDKNWPELLSSHRTIDRRRIRGINGRSERSAWKKISSLEELRDQKLSASRHHERLQKAWIRSSRSSEKLKTYADAVQVTSSLQLNPEFNEIQEIDSSIMNLRENRRPSKMCPSFFHTSTPKIELRGVTAKREYPESCEEDTEHSSTSTASNGSYFGRSRTPESTSSLETAYCKNSKGSSSSSPVQEIEEDNNNEESDDDGRGKNISSKRLCKMAETFCFGELENAAFFRVFDEYNRRRRRMSYTQQLEDGTEMKTTSFCKNDEGIQAEVTVVSTLSFDRKRELFGRGNETTMMTPVRIDGNNGFNGFNGFNGLSGINGIKEQGAFKVLQKAKECPDGTGSIYTNSWRSEELHYLQSCCQDKNI